MNFLLLAKQKEAYDKHGVINGKVFTDEDIEKSVSIYEKISAAAGVFCFAFSFIRL